MKKTDKEVLELCKAWFEDIMERCNRLTSGNVSHGSRAIHGVSKNYAEFIAEHLKERYTWKPSEEQMKVLSFYADQNNSCGSVLTSLLDDLKKLRNE